MNDRERTAELAGDIAAELSKRGLPVIGFAELDCGGKVGISFQLDGAKYAVRCPVEKATPEWFADAYRVVA